MKTRLIQMLSVLLAALLQLAPLLRSILPAQQGLAPSTWAIVLKIGVGAVALIGFDAVSQASSISISPANAVVGSLYSGTITYSGGHAGSVNSMTYSNNCIGSAFSFLDGLTIVYGGGNKATVSGTPTNASSYLFSVKVWSGSGCSGSHSDTRSTTLVVGSSGGGTVAPTLSAAPPNTCAQVGTDVQLSGGAGGNPIPQYQWWQNAQPIAGATNSVLSFSNIQLTNAGVYTLTASNLANVGQSFALLPKANCYLSVCITGGTNYSALDYINYAPAANALTMFSLLTNNTTSTTNYYIWQKGGVPASTSNTLSLTASQVIPAQSSIYTVSLSSSNAGGGIVVNQNYDSYWSFGFLPAFTNQLPATTNINAGNNVTFNLNVRGTLDASYGLDVNGNFVNQTNAVPNVFWLKNGVVIASNTLVLNPSSGTLYTNNSLVASLSLTGVTGADAATYTAVATNFWGSVTSSPVVLSVAGGGTAPSITAQPPAGLSLIAGQNSTIGVFATGTAPLAYQWRNGSGNLANSGVFGGVTTSNLTLTSVTTGNTGNYTVVITNGSGAVTSSVTALNVGVRPTIGSVIAGANIQLTGTTLTNVTYVVQRNTNLTTSVWTPILTNNTGASGVVNFQTNSTSLPNAYYRLLFP